MFLKRHFGPKGWKTFARDVRSKGCGLLGHLGDYPDSILVSGCQRSGTTVLSRLFRLSPEIASISTSVDDELLGANMLAGQTAADEAGRYCFQTTYLNECYREYFSQSAPFKLVWVVRNPYSVVYSMLYNWRRFPLNELFESCGVHLLSGKPYERYRRFGALGVNPLTRACLGYAGKQEQIISIARELGSSRLFVVDYDDLVSQKEELIPELFRFAELPYDPRYSEMLASTSLGKEKRLTRRERNIIKEECEPVYERVRKLVTTNQ